MTKTLLAVEDSKTMRKVLEITFASGEFQITTLESAQQALEQLDSVSPQVALVDVTLPGTNGYDLCRQLKARLPGLPVVILSSTQQPFDPARGGEVHADDYIDKPFDSQVLRDKIDRLATRTSGLPPRLSAVPATASQPAAAASAPPAAARMPSAPAAAAARSVPPPLPGLGTSRSSRPSVPAPQPVAGAAVNGALDHHWAERLGNLGLDAGQIQAVTALSREVIERVVWEVVPPLAETLIKEEIARLTRD